MSKVKYYINNGIVTGKIEDMIIDAGTCFVMTTSDDKTIVLNDVGAFIFKNCMGRTIDEMIVKFKEEQVGGLPEEKDLRKDFEDFLNILLNEQLVIIVDGEK
ncbi:MAG: PqqD family protein [Lachnospiraceae bacterium]|nr:PqqD family protein [Lachnospiraceae bacterium]